MTVMNATDQVNPAVGSPAVAEPRIVAFVCKWCTYAGADLAGTSRMTYPPNVRTIMLPCTGRIDMSFVLRAFLQGADGVVVSGCHPGDCHYTAGNYRARRRWTLFRDMLDVIGFDLNRLAISWVSAAEGAKWVKIITEFTEKIRQLGPYDSLHKVSRDHAPRLALPAASDAGGQSDGPSNGAVQLDPQVSAAAVEALKAGKVKAVVGWLKNKTLGRPRPTWMTEPEAVAGMVAPGETANLARFFKRPELRLLLPVGVVARPSEVMALNVMIQEAQIDPAQVVLFTVDASGKFLGTMDIQKATTLVVEGPIKSLDPNRPAGFSDETIVALDELMARLPEQRWQYWAEQFEKCIKCYACRASCPMCGCDTCFADKNQPQWFPTAADGPGNMAWHMIRAFHLAGRCVGCGACQEACPAGIPMNILGAAMARSALSNFEHRAGVDSGGVPLQSDYRNEDREGFIL